MVHYPLVIVDGQYHGLYSMVHCLLVVDTMDYGPWSTFRCYTHVLIWTIVHGQLSVGHAAMSIP